MAFEDKTMFLFCAKHGDEDELAFSTRFLISLSVEAVTSDVLPVPKFLVLPYTFRMAHTSPFIVL